MTPAPAALPDYCAIDFGTSNSAVAIAGAGGMHLVPLEPDHGDRGRTMPTAVFYLAEGPDLHNLPKLYGRAATKAYVEGTEGRLMRSMKSVLGSALMDQRTDIGAGRTVAFGDVISSYLLHLRRAAIASAGHDIHRVVMGRPVFFVDDDPARDAQAQAALAEAARAVGFTDVRFQYEPIAAAFHYEERAESEQIVLVADIGGGTSDFTVVRLGPDRVAHGDRTRDVLATGGVHIGGTDFDQRLSIELVMPHLGYRHTGPDGREVPSRVFFDLSSWHLINWLYAPKALREARDLRTNYSDLQIHDRLMEVLTERHGHRIASEVEAAKIACSDSDAAAHIDLSFAEAGLGAELAPASMQTHLALSLETVAASAAECIRAAGLQAGAIDAIYLTGGSSALRPFRRAMRERFPGVELVEGDLFGGVAAGLAYAASRQKFG
jgi:hypothetical chaperone protein